jgi:hypothetical protein
MIYITQTKASFKEVLNYKEELKKIDNPFAMFAHNPYIILDLENKTLFKTPQEKETVMKKLEKYAEKNKSRINKSNRK